MHAFVNFVKTVSKTFKIEFSTIVQQTATVELSNCRYFKKEIDNSILFFFEVTCQSKFTVILHKTFAVLILPSRKLSRLLHQGYPTFADVKKLLLENDLIISFKVFILDLLLSFCVKRLNLFSNQRILNSKHKKIVFQKRLFDKET